MIKDIVVVGAGGFFIGGCVKPPIDQKLLIIF